MGKLKEKLSRINLRIKEAGLKAKQEARTRIKESMEQRRQERHEYKKIYAKELARQRGRIIRERAISKAKARAEGGLFGGNDFLGIDLFGTQKKQQKREPSGMLIGNINEVLFGSKPKQKRKKQTSRRKGITLIIK